MTFQTIITTIDDNGCGTITLNRAERRNAISILMRKEISACLAKWQEDDHVGCVIITGAGNAFSAGFDLDEFKQVERHSELLESSSRYHRDLWNFSKPIIAAINGPALGGGFDLACFCDIRIAATTASFGHPEIKFGAPPLYTPLRRIVGDGHARELCLTGRRIDSAEALRIGLVSSVHDAEHLIEEVGKLAVKILEAPIDALRYAKRTFIAADASGFEQSFAMEHDRAFREILLNRFAG
jgi:enoyl-CoA hydratase